MNSFLVWKSCCFCAFTEKLLNISVHLHDVFNPKDIKGISESPFINIFIHSAYCSKKNLNEFIAFVVLLQICNRQYIKMIFLILTLELITTDDLKLTKEIKFNKFEDTDSSIIGFRRGAQKIWGYFYNGKFIAIISTFATKKLYFSFSAVYTAAKHATKRNRISNAQFNDWLLLVRITTRCSNSIEKKLSCNPYFLFLITKYRWQL